MRLMHTGTVISKQKILNFWSHFKRIYLSWAIDLFKDLVATGYSFTFDSMRTRYINGIIECTQNQEILSFSRLWY